MRRMRQAMLSPKELANVGIALDPFRPGHDRGWRCAPCNLGLQNGLTGAREHYRAVHVGLSPKLYLVA